MHKARSLYIWKEVCAVARMIVSILTPAFDAAGTLPRAYAAILEAGVEMFEWVIAADDGRDYRGVLPADPRIVFAPVGPVRSGPGPTRNRALACASGDVIAYLDADDTWAKGYLATLLPLVQQKGLAFGHTDVWDGDTPLIQFPKQAQNLTLEDIGDTGASFHPVLRREMAREMVNRPSQDIRHAVEVLSAKGGTAPLGDTTYQLRLRSGSITTPTDYSARVAEAYRAHMQELERCDLPRAAAVFRAKDTLNTRYMAEANPGESFYHWRARTT